MDDIEDTAPVEKKVVKKKTKAKVEKEDEVSNHHHSFYIAHDYLHYLFYFQSFNKVNI